MKDAIVSKGYQLFGVVFWIISVLGLVATIWWSVSVGAGNLETAGLALALCSASFAVGSVVGFMFTIFGDEQEPLGKIRDAMIALASGIAGAGIANAKQFGNLLGSIHIFNAASVESSSFSILIAISYFVAGFFFMYFARKLSLNPALAEAGKAVDRIQISAKVSVIATRITEKLPQSLLLGREYIEDELKPGEFEGIRKELSTDDVNQFLKACEEDIQSGVRVEPGNVAMAAQIHYYRVYFEKEGTEARDAQERKALDWINRGLMFDPLNPDFQMKLADVYNAQGRYVEAVSMIERLERDDNAPQYIQQWLGYFLLFVDGREGDAIKHSLEFHQRFPDESSGLFNASCGYAQMYTVELRQQGVKELLSSNNRTESLRLLQLALQSDSDQKILARKQAELGQSFESLASDPEFIKLTASTSESKAN
jgi:hypothetical protein